MRLGTILLIVFWFSAGVATGKYLLPYVNISKPKDDTHILGILEEIPQDDTSNIITEELPKETTQMVVLPVQAVVPEPEKIVEFIAVEPPQPSADELTVIEIRKQLKAFDNHFKETEKLFSKHYAHRRYSNSSRNAKPKKYLYEPTRYYQPKPVSHSEMQDLRKQVRDLQKQAFSIIGSINKLSDNKKLSSMASSLVSVTRKFDDMDSAPKDISKNYAENMKKIKKELDERYPITNKQRSY